MFLNNARAGKVRVALLTTFKLITLVNHALKIKLLSLIARKIYVHLYKMVSRLVFDSDRPLLEAIYGERGQRKLERKRERNRENMSE